MPSITWGEIKLNLVGVDFKNVERYRRNIETLITNGVFDISNGKAILTFDQDSNLMGIKFDIERWRRKKYVNEKQSVLEKKD